MLRYTLISLATAFVFLGINCTPKPTPQQQLEQQVRATHMSGTVAEFAMFEGAADLPVQGYGVVVGLGTNGSREVPAHVKPYLVEYLGKLGFGSASKNLLHMTPSKVLSSTDTAVVLIGGAIPFGAPPGTKFDLFIEAMPNTQTRSLWGGCLLQSELRFADRGMAIPGGPTRPLAAGQGDVFCNPFVDPNDEREMVKWRSGRVLGGGTVGVPTPILLVLRQPDYARADLLQRRINEVFGANAVAVAKATGRRVIEITVPKEWHKDYQHFLQLVLHIPLDASSNYEVRARDLIRAMEAPDAPCQDIAMILEATGRQIVPILKSHYTDSNPNVAYFCSRTGVRLRDETAGTVVVRFAKTPSPLQLEAIGELGRRNEILEAQMVLHDLLDDDNMSTRIAAYDALVRRGDRRRITRLDVDKQFKLDIVECQKTPLIYATQTDQPRLVVFGKAMPVKRPMFFNTSDDLVTVRCNEGEEKLTVFRKTFDNRFSDSYEVNPDVQSLVLKLGSRPMMGDDGSIKGLGLSYCQLVAVLHGMCQKGDIPAKFNLQELAPSPTIYDSNAPVIPQAAPPAESPK